MSQSHIFPNQSNSINCSHYFNNCIANELNLSNFSTSKVTDMNNMFYYCLNLTSLDLSKIFPLVK